MSKIINITEGLTIPGEVRLEWVSDDIPEDFRIMYGNTRYCCKTKAAKLWKGSWAWMGRKGFHSQFETPEEALEDLKEMLAEFGGSK